MRVDYSQYESSNYAYTPSKTGARANQPFAFMWSRGFFLLPIVVSLVLGAGLLAVRRSLFSVMLNWALSWPLGFGVWLLLWFVWGPGTGTVSALVIAASSIGWVLFWLGILHATARGKPSIGLDVSAVALGTLLALKLLMPEETSLIGLTLLGITLGVVIAACYLMLRRALAIGVKPIKGIAPGKLAAQV